MKIIVFKDLKNNCILSVSSMEYYHGKKIQKTEADIEKAITEFNMVHHNEEYKTIDCSDEVYEAIQFILGEGQYKKAHTLEDVFLQLTNLRDSVDGMKSNLERMQFDLVDTMNNVDSQIEKLNKQKEGDEE